MNYLERICEIADHIKECTDLLTDKASNEGFYEIEGTDEREFIRDLIHTIGTDAKRMAFAFQADAPESPWDSSPHYLKVESRYLSPEESTEQGMPKQWGNKRIHSRRTGIGDSTADVTPLFKGRSQP